MRALLAAVLAALFVMPAHALVWTGQLPESNSRNFLALDYAVSTDIVARSTSYAGGGFDPILSLFDAASGDVLIFNDDNPNPPAGSSSPFYDSYFEFTVDPGSYLLGISQYAIFPSSLTEWLGDVPTGCGGAPFCDVLGDTRTSDYRVVVEASPVPVPPALGLLAAALGGLMLVKRGRRTA